MIIIDKSEEISSFLNKGKECELPIVRLDCDTYEMANGLEGDLVIVHSDHLNSMSDLFRKKLSSHKMLVIFNGAHLGPDAYLPNTVLDFTSEDDTQKVCINLERLEGCLKESMVLKSQLLTMNKELSEVLGNVETELLRVKRAYEINAPKRFQDLKNIKLLSKYAAGESVGGEFFDILKSGNKVFFLMSETSSYLASSSILQIFQEFKDECDISEESEIKLLKEIQKEVMEINSNKKKPLKISVFTGILDLTTHKFSGHMFGKFQLLSSDQKRSFNGNKLDLLKDQFSEAKYERSFERGERVLFLSPGFLKCWEDVAPEFIIETLMNNSKIKMLDILDEIFFQLKKDVQTGFLPHDASAIMLEVQKNVMLKV